MMPVAVLLVCLPLQASAEHSPKPVPAVQSLPLPRGEVSFQKDGREITRYIADPTTNRPFLYPVNGPSGRSLTRMGHPHDPHGHRHHYSVWTSHQKVDGVNFWADQGDGRIVPKEVMKLSDGDKGAAMLTRNEWVDGAGKRLLNEFRQVSVEPLPDGESLITIDLEFKSDRPTTFQKTPFGVIGVRMAKPIGVHDGGGVIQNAEGAINEKAIFRKPTRWVDYSGNITNDSREGITLFDHPANINHPAPFHVRNDGWMGACLTLDEPIEVAPDKPLRLRYQLYVHGDADPSTIEERWKQFAKTTPEPLRKSK
ncbi:hypothetical protein Pan216_57820 [Planctomycetes bacterium Pan216]|uniref:Methane oxygenase PmoA n=1 Tax=Kolteria novifilia TaxID=2527975 RepID=A0A518BD28_9BACT|nr:hypothetical protein Pan216_57820 [Planctomycetes bacterium Pan216]